MSIGFKTGRRLAYLVFDFLSVQDIKVVFQEALNSKREGPNAHILRERPLQRLMVGFDCEALEIYVRLK